MSIIDCQLLPELMDITKLDFLHIHCEECMIVIAAFWFNLIRKCSPVHFIIHAGAITSHMINN